MAKRVDSRDVMDANARTRRVVSVTVLGHFRRVGPNSWDDYEFVSDPPERIEIAPNIPVQLEAHGLDLRLRRRGKVVRVRWTPTPEDEAELGAANATASRACLVEHYLVMEGAPRGIGAAAVIATKLGG